MNILGITAAGVCISIVALSVKNMKGEMGQLISVAATLVITAAVIPYVVVIVRSMNEFATLSNMGESFITPILKITGIAYISQIGSELCCDSGEKALASRIEMAGKIAISVISLPIAREAFLKIVGILS